MELAFAQRGAQPSIVSITSAFRLSPIAPPPSFEGEGARRRLPGEDQKSGEDAEVLDEVLHLTVARNAGMIIPEVMQHEIDQQDVDDKPEGREFHMASINEPAKAALRPREGNPACFQVWTPAQTIKRFWTF